VAVELEGVWVGADWFWEDEEHAVRVLPRIVTAAIAHPKKTGLNMECFILFALKN
jgi:hypothetical protein